MIYIDCAQNMSDICNFGIEECHAIMNWAKNTGINISIESIITSTTRYTFDEFRNDFNVPDDIPNKILNLWIQENLSCDCNYIIYPYGVIVIE